MTTVSKTVTSSLTQLRPQCDFLYIQSKAMFAAGVTEEAKVYPPLQCLHQVSPGQLSVLTVLPAG